VKSFHGSPPQNVRQIAVLDRTKESGAIGEPLYLDVVNALHEAKRVAADALVRGADAVRVVGGRYGLSSKEFTPAMVKAVYDNLKKPEPKDHFTIGINDDVTHTSLDYDASSPPSPTA
jgi:pyruvate-ferredoxin/flavodoxin oxidoreductase